MRIDFTNMDERDRRIYDTADSFYAVRFEGRASYNRLGPFSSSLGAVTAIEKFFVDEDREYPPPEYIYGRPFAIYAVSSSMNGSQIILGNIFRDRKEHLTPHQLKVEREAAKKKVKIHD